MIDLQKIKETMIGLAQQRDEIQKQLNMVDGALQLCRQLIEEGEKSPSESVMEGKETP